MQSLFQCLQPKCLSTAYVRLLWKFGLLSEDRSACICFPFKSSPKYRHLDFFKENQTAIWHAAPNVSQNLPHKPLAVQTLVLLLFHKCWSKWNYPTVRQKQGQEMTPWEALLDSNGKNEAVNHCTVWWWDSAVRLINTLIRHGMDAHPDVFLSAEAAEGFQGLQWVCWRLRNY